MGKINPHIFLKKITEGQRFELMFDIAFGKKCQYSQVKMVNKLNLCYHNFFLQIH
jgi:hypothetical protein